MITRHVGHLHSAWAHNEHGVVFSHRYAHARELGEQYTDIEDTHQRTGDVLWSHIQQQLPIRIYDFGTTKKTAEPTLLWYQIRIHDQPVCEAIVHYEGEGISVTDSVIVPLSGLAAGRLLIHHDHAHQQLGLPRRWAKV